MNESALLAARRRKEKVGRDEVEEAMERVMAGPERKSRVMSQKEREVIAFHESGHALVGHVLENSDPIHKISIIARGQALGYTMQVPEQDHFLSSRDEMLDQIAVLLGGRTAEEPSAVTSPPAQATTSSVPPRSRARWSPATA